MYRVIGRRVLDGGRLGEYLVEFSREWRTGARKIYLIGDFTSVYPGFYSLRKIGDRGYAKLRLWWGIYGYGFIVDNDFGNILDPENESKLCRRSNFHPDQTICLSKAVIEKPQNPLDAIYHYEGDESYLHIFGNKLVVRIRHPIEVRDTHIELDNGIIEDSITYLIGSEVIKQFIIKPLSEYLHYRFVFRYGGETLYYGYEGVAENPSYIRIKVSNIAGVRKPQWFMGTIYYQIFVDSFNNGDPFNDPPIKISVYEPREHGYYGGDLKGILEKIDYIEGLGVETIYLTPIFRSNSYHRYDVIDYYSIDPYLGSLEDFDNLVNELKKRGIRVVLDVTPHHCSPCHEFFKDIILNWDNSRYWNWFTIFYKPPDEVLNFIRDHLIKSCSIREIYRDAANNPYLWKWFSENKPFYESFFTNWFMVKFNHENPETLDYFLNITKFWIDRGVDGFRIDVAMGIHHTWLKEYYVRVKDVKEDFLILAEVSEEPSIYYDLFDSIMCYYLRRLLFEKLIFNSISIQNFVEELNKLYTSIPHYKAVSLYNLLGSHDTPRLKTVANNDRDLVKLMYVLIFILPGSPAIYYGDEIGMEGGKDPDCRRPMVWDGSRWDLDMLYFIKSLIKIYKSSNALRHGFFEIKILDSNTLLIKRWVDEEEVYVLLNLFGGDAEAELELPPGKYYDPISNEELEITKTIMVRLGRFGFKILLSRDTSSS
ncbi:MAG: glycoside hydrolase family 13 protein [Desulfurococcaceae archaeon]